MRAFLEAAGVVSRVTVVVVMATLGVGCGRVGYQPGLASDAGDGGDTGLRDASSDTSVGDAGADSSRPGDAGADTGADTGTAVEMILAAGWEFEVAVDLSGDFTYVREDFLDGFWLDNSPTDFITIGVPFETGVAVLVGRELLVYDRATGAVTHRDLTPAAPNDTGPDFPTDLAFSPPGLDGMGVPGVWLGSGSLGGGDGLFRFDVTWSLSRVSQPGNISFIAPDVAGVVPDRSSTVTYFGLVSSDPANGGISSVGGTKFIDGNIEDGTILADGRMLVIDGDITVTPMRTRIGIVDGATFTQIEDYVPEIQRLLRGDVGAYGFMGMAINFTGSVYGVEPTGSTPPIAQEPTTEWRWSSAQVVSTGILGFDTTSILVLRSRFDTSQLQLIRIWRPGT